MRRRRAACWCLPVLFEGETKAVIELASFKPFVPNHLSFLDQLMVSLGVILNMISSSMRTEELLIQLKKSNAELEAQAGELNDKAKLLEVKNNEVELASRSLEEKAEQLQLISKYKSEFLANMSHELRTPLNSLLILSQVLAENRDGNLTGDQVKFAQTVYTSGNELLALINEILDLSKVEAGKMPILPKTFRLDDIKDYLDQTFHHVADQKGLAFEIHMDKELPEALFTDVNRLQQILKNLLSNAFKFTSRGGVKIASVLVLLLRNGETRVSFAVRRHGHRHPARQAEADLRSLPAGRRHHQPQVRRDRAGPHHQPRDSAPARRVDRGGEHARRGQRLHSARAEDVHGPDSSGLRDEDSDESADLAELSPLPKDADLTGTKVLLVDDDTRNLFAMRTVLEARGVRVLHALNGKEALELLERNSDLDLVFMDTMMPEMDGLTATSEIRERLALDQLPIVSLTAKAMKGDREKALAAGASDYVTKPVAPERLLSVIHHWRRKGAERAAQ